MFFFDKMKCYTPKDDNLSLFGKAVKHKQNSDKHLTKMFYEQLSGHNK